MAITANYTAGTNTLSVFGDNADNIITISRNAAGVLLVNGGAVAITGGAATVANTTLIQGFGLGGNDVITLDETNGALPRANLFGGAGNDVLVGGSGADQLFGQDDNDTLVGKGGADFLFGGAGNDVLTGGDADDQMFGEAGDDRLIWNPGDDSDLFEGGAGTDTAEVNGGNGAETFSLTANGARVRFDRIDPAPFSLDIGTTERVVVNMNGGDDRFSATGNLAALVGVTVDGGTGNDTILGSNGNDLLLGGDGNDFIDGQQGNDTALLGAGNDTFQWDPGDGSDVVEGQDGQDTLLFNGANIAENIDISANGGRARFFRDVANVTMDLNDVEQIAFKALGGADIIVVGDLSGTDVSNVSIDLGNGSGGGDGQADTVSVNGTGGDDVIDVFGAGQSASVAGLQAAVTLSGLEAANDSLVINGGGGADRITATTMQAGIVKLTIDAGGGNDTVFGSQGADLILGGEGNDVVFGDNGNDIALLGAGNDIFDWDPGDGSDTIEGQAGADTLDFDGANIGENIDISANGGRVRFFRDVANVTMDLDDVETIAFEALGGADSIVVGDLSGTDASEVAIDLNGSAGDVDGSADTVTVNGTNGVDIIAIADAAGIVSVTGLRAAVRITGADLGLDRLTVNGQGGDDIIDASGLRAGRIALTVNGGLGADRITGSAGADLVFGGDGNDLAFLGAGDDTFVWNPGDDNDTVEGQGGTDTLLFNGANIAENIDISANGGRARFFRDVANVTMDLNDVETIAFNAFGGADHIVVNDLSGTDVSSVAIDLGDANGNGDGQADTVDVRGSGVSDTIRIETDGNQIVTVSTPHTNVLIDGAEIGNDRLNVFGGVGNDAIDARGTHTARLFLYGEAGIDTLVSSSRADVLDGGLDSDTASFAGSTVGVSVDLSTGIATGGDAQGDILIAIENLLGSAFADTLTGNAGNNILVGGNGADTLRGLAGNDVYSVDNAGDLVFEAAGGGTDRVSSTVSYILAAGQSVEELHFTNAAATTTLNLTGNELNQSLTGNAGNNILVGGGGVDTMRALAGDDFYSVDNAGDQVFETAGQGTDAVSAAVSYTLAAGQSIEVMYMSNAAATTALNLTGNELAQSLSGNAGNNTLVGGGGADTMRGLGGNDAYSVDNVGDVVFEAAGQGTDRVSSSVSYTLAAGQSVESLYLTDAASVTALNLVGNDLAQILSGNAGNNLLDGKGGADTLRGYGGNDSFQFSTALGAGNIDHIADFSVADDTIRLDQTVFAALGLGTLTSTAYKDIGGGAAVDADDRVLYDHDTGQLFYDSNGSGAGGRFEFAVLDNKPAVLTHVDFLVVA